MQPSRWEKIEEAYEMAEGLPDAELGAFLASLPDDIRPDLERLIAADRDAGDFIERPFVVETGLVDEDLEETQVPDLTEVDEYTLIESIGSGGMGTVYLAERRGQEFTQRVALKIIKRGLNTDAVLKRFLTERRILAGLEHPNIARMLDGGSTADGLPYFVMEHVKGEPLKAYCEKQRLDIRGRLSIFVKICSAVNHAHQQLVVHRDLKPSNILVTDDGEPKLLDFGIAKILTADRGSMNEAATVTQGRVMTPEYASPEQLRGEPTTTLTDIYSLGVLLYEMLTGVRPFHSEGNDPFALYHAITSKEPPKPSVAAGSSRIEFTHADDKGTVAIDIHDTGDAPIRSVTHTATPDAKELRGDLDNIVMMAIRREKERRYNSVQELLDDVERYLSGLPVKATGDSLKYRFGKFIGRHRTAAAAAAVVAIALLSSAVVTGYQYRQASIERAKAEARFAEGRKFAGAVIHNHYERIKDLPGSTEAKAGLIADAVNYLDAVSKDSSGDPEFQRELAKAYLKLSEIQGRTAGSGDLGDQAASNASIAKATELLEQLVAAHPDSVEDQRQLAKIYSDFNFAGTEQEKKEKADRAFAIIERLRTANPDKEQAESDYARALWDRAQTQRRNGDTAGAIASFAEAAAIYEKLYNNGAGNKRFRRSASLTYKNLGTVHRLTGDAAAALALFQKAFEYDKQIAAETTDNVDSTLALSFSYRSMAEAQTDLKQYDPAISNFNEAIAIQERVLAVDPKNAFAADAISESYAGIAIVFRDYGDYRRSEESFRKAFDRIGALHRDKAKADPLRRQLAAKVHLDYAEMLIRKGGETAKAREELLIARSVFDEASSTGTLDPALAPSYERTKQLMAKV